MSRLPALRRYAFVTVGLLRRVARRILVRLLILAGAACVITGVALVFAPAAFIVAGAGVFALLTFDPDRAGRMTWPR